jgi:hypothetical protein
MRNVALIATVTACAAAHAETTSHTRAVIDTAGSHLETTHQEVAEPGIRPPSPAGGGGWTYSHVSSIPQTLGIGSAAGRVWVGQYLNVERMQEFDLHGTGTPLDEFPAVNGSLTVVHAADAADLAIVLDGVSGSVVLKAYTSASLIPEWEYSFAANFGTAGFRSARVSRDGSRVCVLVIDSEDSSADLHIFDGANGALLNNWTYPGFANGVDLNDDGSLCLVTQSTNGRLIDTATVTEIFTAPGSGGGAWHRISGNGEVLALGGFSFHVYKKIGPVYTQVTNFSTPTSWFGNGVGISRDGSTVVVMSHNYSDYLQTVTRIIDVDTQALLGQHDTVGTGSLQDSVSGAEVSDDGSVIAVSSWGTQNNAHPEVMIFDHDGVMIGSINTVGSPFSLDVSGDGLSVSAGSKSVHANVNGNGGTVTTLHFPPQCPWDCGDNNGEVGIVDFLELLAQWDLVGTACDFDNDGVSIVDFLKLLGNWGECPP